MIDVPGSIVRCPTQEIHLLVGVAETPGTEVSILYRGFDVTSLEFA